MREVLSSAGLQFLNEFFKERPLVVFDFDGTLVPISENRDQVQLSRLTQALIQRLSRWTSVAVVSGRSLADLKKKFFDSEELVLIGNHGGEIGNTHAWFKSQEHESAHLQLELFLRALKDLPVWARIPEQSLENKGLSVTFHWRHLDHNLALDGDRVIRQLASVLGGFRVISGIQSTNVIPSGLPNKGDAVRRLFQASGLMRLVYLGDDETDEDVFRQLSGRAFLGIHVGPQAKSLASWAISEQSEVDRVVEVFLALLSRVAAPLGLPGAVTPVKSAFP